MKFRKQLAKQAYSKVYVCVCIHMDKLLLPSGEEAFGGDVPIFTFYFRPPVYF